MRIIEEEQLDFDDLMLMPQHSDMNSRKEVILEREIKWLGNDNIQHSFNCIPIMAANMIGIGCPSIAKVLVKNKCICTMEKHYTFDQLDSAVCRALSIPDGRFALILPTEQMDKYLSLTSLKLRRRCDVSTKPNTPPKRTMAELALQAGEVEYSTLTIDTQVHGIYTDQYRELTKDFYLKF